MQCPFDYWLLLIDCFKFWYLICGRDFRLFSFTYLSEFQPIGIIFNWQNSNRESFRRWVCMLWFGDVFLCACHSLLRMRNGDFHCLLKQLCHYNSIAILINWSIQEKYPLFWIFTMQFWPLRKLPFYLFLGWAWKEKFW